MPIRVLHVGLGPIGNAIVRQCASRRRLKVVGAVDVDAAKVGRDLAEVVGLDRKLNVTVAPEIVPAIRKAKPDVVVLCTSSSLKKITPQLQAILSCRVPIVSTTEELAYPFYSNKRLATRIDQMAKRAKAAVLGTGVNPGFTMDALPITLTCACERVDTILVERIQDASTRRLPFQQKIGAGLTEAEFQARVDEGSVRHVGLTESIAMIADAMGWKLDEVTDVIKPKLAVRPVKSPFLAVKKGQVAGIIQDGVGSRRGEPLITLHMEAYLGAPESYDAVTLAGVPNLYSKIPGGVPGDIATASVTINSIPKVIAAPPGLHTMRSLQLPSWFGG
ncbi:MAG: NAD(P)H-dependent amine dehydrogenase family protein [Vicinamibacteraceae bacterium]